MMLLTTKSFASVLGRYVGGCLVINYGLMRISAFPQDLSHAAIEMHTSIGRLRSAKFVGKDLAEFYM